MRPVGHVYDDQLLEQVSVKIVLPEHEKHYAYLDTVGRPVIVISKRNMLFQHIQDFEIHHTFDKIMPLNEPMLIVIPLFCLVIVLARLNFAITHNESNEIHMRIQAIWDQVIKNNLKRTSFYQNLEDGLNASKIHKDLKLYNEQRKKLETEQI